MLFGQTYNEARKKRSISESYAEHPTLGKEFQTLSLGDEISQLREAVRTRDDEIKNLKREIHKLKVCMPKSVRREACLIFVGNGNSFYLICKFAFIIDASQVVYLLSHRCAEQTLPNKLTSLRTSLRTASFMASYLGQEMKS